MQKIIDFTPKADWQWVIDLKTNKLTLHMENCQVELVYKVSMLVLDFDFPLYFTLEDVINYNKLMDTLPLVSFSEALSNKIILHILAIELFHKPIMPQCWLFDIATQKLQEISESSIYSLKSKKSKTHANYMLVELTDEFALCLLLDKKHNLSARKTFQQFHVVKVTKELLHPMWHEGQNNWTSYQIG